jgi:hypothetical protein
MGFCTLRRTSMKSKENDLASGTIRAKVVSGQVGLGVGPKSERNGVVIGFMRSNRQIEGSWGDIGGVE